MVAMYGLLLVPMWLPSPEFHFWLSLVSSALVLLCLVIPIAVRGREEVVDGTKLEASAPAHMALLASYLTQPAISTAIEAAQRQ